MDTSKISTPHVPANINDINIDILIISSLVNKCLDFNAFTHINERSRIKYNGMIQIICKNIVRNATFKVKCLMKNSLSKISRDIILNIIEIFLILFFLFNRYDNTIKEAIIIKYSGRLVSLSYKDIYPAKHPKDMGITIFLDCITLAINNAIPKGAVVLSSFNKSTLLTNIALTK
ncbi:putative hypothetical protein [Clostridium botulinum BKT015925]|nr:putative hypothetical protein [Clostridium botulinum BKT015925]